MIMVCFMRIKLDSFTVRWGIIEIPKLDLRCPSHGSNVV